MLALINQEVRLSKKYFQDKDSTFDNKSNKFIGGT